MKRFKKFFSSLLVAVLLGVMCFGVTACSEDIRTIKVKVSVYDAEATAMVEKELKVDLYRHLAPDTVDKIIEYVGEGYYNDAMFYVNGSHGSQIMMGDYKYSGGNIVKNSYKPTIEGEFEKGGTIGSDLVSKEGAVGLWRTWVKNDKNYAVSDDARDSGSATWFLPTSSISGYNGWFCVFALIDLEDKNNLETWELIKSVLNTEENYVNYTVYYTGVYDAEKSFGENHGLTFNAVLSDNFDDDTEVFEAENGQYTCYNKHTLKVPVYKLNGSVKGLGAKIISMEMA